MAHDTSGEDHFAGTGTANARRGVRVHERNKSWYWLFLLPFFGVFLPWIYNTGDPELFGIPFFYWYQMLWVPLTVILTIIVYRKTTGDA
jgi:hypothetical protein